MLRKVMLAPVTYRLRLSFGRGRSELQINPWPTSSRLRPIPCSNTFWPVPKPHTRERRGASRKAKWSGCGEEREVLYARERNLNTWCIVVTVFEGKCPEEFSHCRTWARYGAKCNKKRVVRGLVVFARSILLLCWLKIVRRSRFRRITSLSFLQVDFVTFPFLTLIIISFPSNRHVLTVCVMWKMALICIRYYFGKKLFADYD